MLAQAERELGDELPHPALALGDLVGPLAERHRGGAPLVAPVELERDPCRPGWKRVISSLKSFSRVTGGRSPS